MDRRMFMKLGGTGLGVVLGARYLGSALPVAHAADGPYGALRTVADPNGILLPNGFSSRVMAISGQNVPGTSYNWPAAPDGGACFPDGAGWIYVANSELGAGAGGVSALRVDGAGNVTSAYRILGGTSRNCAGGPTPWNSWLSCEENGSGGYVWETDPYGGRPAVRHTAMGAFNHEAAACDPVDRYVYLTEDASSGKLRRYRPAAWGAWGDLASGTLEAAVVSNGTVSWTTTISNGTSFNGGEGAWYGDGKVWFTTKGDNRVWELDVRAQPNTIRVIYDDSTSPTPVLTGVDNIVGTPIGDLYVAEDGGNMELVLVEPSGAVSVFLRVLNQSGSELAGPAFSPDGSRLYFSSQRGGPNGSGITYEVTGPFRTSGPPTTTTTTSTTTTSPSSITLSASTRRQGRKTLVDLRWSGATSPTVEIRRNGNLLTTTANDGAHTDNLGTATGSFTYQVSLPGGGSPSNSVTVTA